MTSEIDITAPDDGQLAAQLLHAAQRAAEQDRMTWITSGGHRAAAIVPVGVAVALEPGQFSAYWPHQDAGPDIDALPAEQVSHGGVHD